MDIFGLRIFVEVQYDIFKILSPKNIYRSLPSMSYFMYLANKLICNSCYLKPVKKHKKIFSRDIRFKVLILIGN